MPRAACLLLPILMAAAACATPPEKELADARAAIEDARSAGAGQYAAVEYADAEAALKRAEDAVADRDYKLALNYALDTRERARAAARQAAAEKARLRAEAGRAIADLETEVTAATARLQALEPPKGRRRNPALAEGKAAVSTAGSVLQEAREAEAREEFAAAIDRATAAAETLRSTIVRISVPEPAPVPRRKR